MKDLKIASSMTEKDEIMGTGPHLMFPADLPVDFAVDALDDFVPLTEVSGDDDAAPVVVIDSGPLDEEGLRPYLAIRDYGVENVFAVQNWGRSGSTFVQSLFDDHPQVLSTPNFYSRHYFMAWAATIGRLTDPEKIDAFLRVFRQWWDPGLVDATAGLHRLGSERNEIAGVERAKLEGYLRAALAGERPITRRRLFEAAHLAYALARDQRIASSGLQILYPVHGEERAVAAALLEDFPEARFVHTLREPFSNVASLARHLRFNGLDDREDAFITSIRLLFLREGLRSGRRFTIFSDRPYFAWLATSEQAQILRLEDLHRAGSHAIGEVANKLGLSDFCGLGSSTWDGKRWWNRPESGSESNLGQSPARSEYEDCFSARNRTMINVVARCLSAAADHYDPVACSSMTVARIWLFLQIFAPCYPKLRSSPAVAQRLLSISQLPVLPTTFRNQINARLRREIRKGALTRLNAGAVLIRRRLPNHAKSATIRGTLILTERNEKIRARAIAHVGKDKLSEPDRLDAIYLDDARRCSSGREYALWAFILFAGSIASRYRTAFLIRRVIWRACIETSQYSRMDNMITV